MASFGAGRGSSQTRKVPTMRPGLGRPAVNRAATATPIMTGRVSPAESVASSRNRTPKRKAPAAPEPEVGEETNINVVVRCRGRNDREVKENSGVVVSTDGIKGKKVELSMGPSALSNKAYQFDKVFSPASDQGMVFEEVVAPILDEVLNGFNCTIFAYGQTGTGKTYTMSGDISDTLPIPEAAGIIPRVLHTLFAKLGEDEAEKIEHSVKCSFIELYNEELRDLLAADDHTKLKIFDEANKNGRTTTMVQGMEESHIKTASKGIKLLRDGSHKRQVAATKCNDLSSRSHTVFTITVYQKRTSDTGEDFVSAGKLNLVDLAGSENIQRSGAENKRAAEAGLINKSLLTLGRVINALVDKSSHIPYRESKLTRLLQDSLGGRTKTCIIATLSPAKSNLEETISTLDYAFRAKNIRNKPQVNQMVSKKTLLREFTSEIEKLKSELIATRQRNGVYLTAEAYEDITTESESRRILSEEQRDKIETMEVNLRNKVNELFLLTSNFQMLKKGNEETRSVLENTKGVLAKTELVLEHTKVVLAEEEMLRKAHEETEEKLAEVGGDLLGTLETTTNHVDKLHSKLRRRSDLQDVNRMRWADSQGQVVDATMSVEERIEAVRAQQEDLLSSLSGRMQSFVSDEMRELKSSQDFLQQKAAAFEASQSEVNAQTGKSRDDMNEVLREIGTLREDVKQKVGAGLHDLSSAAQRISEGIATELDAFHGQLQESYVTLGRDFKTLFEDLIRRMNEQQAEAQRLRQEITEANAGFIEAGQSSQDHLRQAVEKEREVAAKEREVLLSQIGSMISNSAAAQEARMAGYLESANKRIKTSTDEYAIARQTYGNGMDIWSAGGQGLIDSSIQAREAIKAKLKADWTNANENTIKITETTKAVHGETLRIVNGQMAQMDNQLVALDEIVSRVQTQNEEHHDAHTASLGQLASNVQESYRNIGQHFETSYSRTQALDVDMQDRAEVLVQTLPALADDGEVRQALRSLREENGSAQLAEYSITGETPARTQYTYPTVLPRTEKHETLLNRMRGITSPAKSPNKRLSPLKMRSSPSKSSPSKPQASPTKMTNVFTDTPPALTFTAPAPNSAPTSRPQTARSTAAATFTISEEGAGEEEDEALDEPCKVPQPRFKRHKTDSVIEKQTESKLPTKRSARMTVAGSGFSAERDKENINLSASVGRMGRRLRSRGSD
ncbi:Putative kinesin motor domain, kinesin-associated microtubule-binding domain-containing protein [Septoria linicola]|uniref:Kinesin motor domain, kinesin-associated microtubule-binding domain-containing protein n=1 Tax=Septoria linicola TaxID=215465 RepID=A0A9Q9EGG6_9PEZI|nr:Putative kinesin motor domain, kinesin-associated microtubule-binding domain-containing protein [Septoria linicola]